MSLEAPRAEVPMRDNWRDSLNSAQLEAATHGCGPLLIIAGAGTGKTWTLACRVAHLIQSGVSPERILLLTFSRRAAREMLGRAQRITGTPATTRIVGGTFHAVANRMLRTDGRAVGVQPDFTVLDQGDAADLMNLIRGELHLDKSTRRFPKKETLVSIYSRTVNAGVKLQAVLESHYPWCIDDLAQIAEIFKAYTVRKRAQSVLDYDDLLLHWRALAVSTAGDHMATQFDHVLVDEYQDTNALQADLLYEFHRRIANITVVGDDAQAIYSFRSATVGNILEFPERFSGARVIKLEQNYRSTPPLLDASNAVIELSPQRHAKTLWSAREGDTRPVLITCLDESEQSSAVCESILDCRERGIPLMRQAVLFRSSHHSDLLEVELGRRNIPFVKYGGLKFLEAAHVKDVVALLRVLENPFDEVSWFRVFQLLEGVGPAGARRLMASIGIIDGDNHNGRGDRSPLALLADEDATSIPAAQRSTIATLRSVLADCLGDGGALPLTAQLERIRHFCEPVFERLYTAVESRLRDIEQLEELAGAAMSRAAFLADLALDPPTSTADLAGTPLLDEDFVILSTIHSAKGSEWDVVRIIHAADGMIPSDMATGNTDSVEEERRLLYVAMTRARNTLEVYFPMRYYRRPRGLDDSHGFAQLTRFIPTSVRSRFDERSSFAYEPAGDLVGTLNDADMANSATVDDALAELWTT